MNLENNEIIFSAEIFSTTMKYKSYKINNTSVIHALLALVILTGSFHLYDHNHSEEGGYTICTPGCDTKTHHSLHNDCDTCFKNRYQQKIFYHFGLYNYKNNNLISKYKDVFIFNKYIIYSFSYSRPPPEKIV